MNSAFIDIYYFTGTGNTLKATQAMRGIFLQRGLSVSLRRMETAQAETATPGRMIGLAFPVAAMITYPLVLDFIERLPRGEGTGIFMLDTYAGSGTVIMGPLKRLLTAKGYRPVGARSIRMPANIFFVAEPRRNDTVLSSGLRQAERFAREIMDGTAAWPDGSRAAGALYGVARLLVKLWKWPPHQKLFSFAVNRKKCTRCGICSRFCPTHNITMKDYPEYGTGCQYCLRCAGFCPAGAIASGLVFSKNKSYRAINPEELFNE